MASHPETLSAADVAELRTTHYNSTVREVLRAHEDLAILRVRPDWGRLKYAPGQYTVLGLGNWEQRVAGVQDESLADGQLRQMVKRAYSIGSCLIDRSGRLVRPGDETELEFYVTLVRQAAKHAPALTPRLFALSPGDRLFVGPHAHGSYTLREVWSDHDVIFVATGTGEAPHNAMIAELLSGGHRGRIASITCVRHQRDLAYLAAHRRLEQMLSLPRVSASPRRLWGL